MRNIMAIFLALFSLFTNPTQSPSVLVEGWENVSIEELIKVQYAITERIAELREEEVINEDETYRVVKEEIFQDWYRNYYFLTIKNTSPNTVSYKVDINFWNKKDKLCEYTTQFFDQCAPGHEALIVANCEADFSSVTYEIKETITQPYDIYSSAQPHLIIRVEEKEDRFTIEATNTAEKKAILCKYDIILYDKNGKITDYIMGYWGEIEPGASVIDESSRPKEFDHYSLFYGGKIDEGEENLYKYILQLQQW